MLGKILLAGLFQELQQLPAGPLPPLVGKGGRLPWTPPAASPFTMGHQSSTKAGALSRSIYPPARIRKENHLLVHWQIAAIRKSAMKEITIQQDRRSEKHSQLSWLKRKGRNKEGLGTRLHQWGEAWHCPEPADAHGR